MPETTTIRNLAKAYARQTMEHKAYREARAKFISGVVSGDLKLPVNNYPPLIKPKPDVSQEITIQKAKVRKTETEEEAADITQMAAPDQIDDTPISIPDVNITETNEKPGYNLGIIIGGAVIAIVAVVLAVVMFNSDESADASEIESSAVITTPSPEPEPAQVSGNNAALELIAGFLSNHDWSNSSLDAFIRDWESLPLEAQQAAMGSMELSQLANEIHKQLLEERALAGIGDNPLAEEKQETLMAFAARIGIQDPRLR